MMRLRRVLVHATFLGLTLLSVTFNTSIIGQQSPSPIGQGVATHPDSEPVLLAVTVTDSKGTPVGGLDKSAFTIYEDKIPLEITSFSSKDGPLSVGIVFDLSGSMSGEKRQAAARNALLRFMSMSHSASQYFIVPFAARSQLLIDWTRDGKSAIEEFSKYDFARAWGNTALYDACYLAVEKLSTSSKHKQVVLLISDGQDNNSRYTFREVRQRLKESGALLYSVGFVGGNDPGSSLGMEGKSILGEFSAISGGKAYFPEKKEEIDRAFDSIAQELQHQYLIGFKQSGKADGKWHKIKVKLIAPPAAEGQKQKLNVRSRAGYFAVKDLR